MPPPQQISLIEAIMYGFRFTRANASWLVIICPEGLVGDLRQHMVAAAPDDARCSGRTVRLGHGGCLSVVASTDEIFLPAGTPFSAIFVGWGDSPEVDMKDMHRWKEAASQVVSKVDHD